jgi:predicted ATPase
MAREDGRLVTIVGPGGMGKTRLALAWAENQVHFQNGRANGSTAHPYKHGINFLNLAPLEKADLIIPTLANSLNFPLQKSSDRETRTPRQQILDYLCQKQMLLLFDNFEHLLDGADLIVDILESTQNVKILVTSRERLNLREEQIYPIQGLEFPDWETPQDAAEYTAVQLFLQSARRNLPDFTLTGGDDLTYLARICRLVVGMPLAIELAAAWVEMLSLEAIAAEIQQGLDILETELRDVPPRQRSIRATIDYSWQKLTDSEKEIFIKLSVFRGGFTREAAQAVAGANLRQLAHLQNKSLIQVDRSGHRFQLHELLRQYAAEKLNREVEINEAINGRHAHYYAQLLIDQEPRLFGPNEEEALNQLELERDNIDIAWQWLVDHQEIDPLLEAINALFFYYDLRVRVQDGLARSQQLINWCSDTADPKKKLLLARALNWHCNLNAFHLYDAATMETNIVRAAELLAELSQGSNIVIDDDLAFNEYLTGLFVHPGVVVSQEAMHHYETALNLFQKAGNLRGMIITLEQIVGARFFSSDDQGGYKVALELSDQALKIARLFKSNRLMTDLVAEIGTFALQAGDFSLMETLMVSFTVTYPGIQVQI